jgi:hypothetical protein
VLIVNLIKYTNKIRLSAYYFIKRNNEKAIKIKLMKLVDERDEVKKEEKEKKTIGQSIRMVNAV